MAQAEITRPAITLDIWSGLARGKTDVQAGFHALLRSAAAGIYAARFTWAAIQRRCARRVGRCFPRRLSADERHDRAAIREHVNQRLIFIAAQREMERRWWKTSKKESKMIGRLLSQKLGQLGLDYIFSLDGNKMRRMVKFSSVEITRDQYIYQVDSRRLPRGVSEMQIIQPDVIQGLMCTVKKQVNYHIDPEGLFLKVERESGLWNIPRYVQFEDCINAITSTDGPLVIPLGQGNNRRLIKIDLQHDTTAHFLIGGTTGAGKTNAIHSMICTLAQRNPIEIKMVLIDLKGFEFPQYRDLPHLEMPIVTEPADVLNVIKALWDECQIRKKMLQEETTINNIKAYNARREMSKRLPYIVVFFDELANVMLDKTLKHKAEIESYLARIASMSRAVGIHLVLATQRPCKEVLTGLITANFPGRIGLACSSVVDSMTIIGNGDSCFHEAVPPGRANLCYGRHRMQFQISWLSDGKRAEIVADAVAGKFGVRRMYHDVTIQDLAIFSAREWEGEFKEGELYRQFKDRGVSHYDIRHMQQRYTNEPFEIDGQQFILEQQNRRGSYLITPYLVNEKDGSDESRKSQVAETLQERPAIDDTHEPCDPLAPFRKQTDALKAEKNGRLEKACAYLFENPSATTGDLAKRLGLSRPTAKRYIAQLQDDHRIRRSYNGWEAIQVVDAQPEPSKDDEYDQFSQRVSELIGDKS
jgi:hypothetical protein